MAQVPLSEVRLRAFAISTIPHQDGYDAGSIRLARLLFVYGYAFDPPEDAAEVYRRFVQRTPEATIRLLLAEPPTNTEEWVLSLRLFLARAKPAALIGAVLLIRSLIERTGKSFGVLAFKEITRSRPQVLDPHRVADADAEPGIDSVGPGLRTRVGYAINRVL